MTSNKKLQLSQSQEDYLESIYVLTRDEGVARSKDISKRLDVNSSSVTGALRSLSSLGLVNYEPYGTVTLTASGQKLARKVAERHRMLLGFFENILGVDSIEADRAACYMEHSGSGEVVRRLGMMAEFIDSRDGDSRKWLSEFNKFCLQNKADTEVK